MVRALIRGWIAEFNADHDALIARHFGQRKVMEKSAVDERHVAVTKGVRSLRVSHKQCQQSDLLWDPLPQRTFWECQGRI